MRLVMTCLYALLLLTFSEVNAGWTIKESVQLEGKSYVQTTYFQKNSVKIVDPYSARLVDLSAGRVDIADLDRKVRWSGSLIESLNRGGGMPPAKWKGQLKRNPGGGT